MDVSSIMASNLRDLQQTVSLSIVNKSMTGQAAAAQTMLQDFQSTNPAPARSSPYSFDVYA